MEEPAINAIQDEYLNSALAEDHHAFGYQGDLSDRKPSLRSSRWRAIAAFLAVAAVGCAGLIWLSA